MIKEILGGDSLTPFAVLGLVFFVAVFVSVGLWALTRSRRQVATWSSLPLADGYDPVEPRAGSVDTPKVSDSLSIVSKEKSGSCGKCENCDCDHDPT